MTLLSIEPGEVAESGRVQPAHQRVRSLHRHIDPRIEAVHEILEHMHQSLHEPRMPGRRHHSDLVSAVPTGRQPRFSDKSNLGATESITTVRTHTHRTEGLGRLTTDSPASNDSLVVLAEIQCTQNRSSQTNIS